MPLDELTDEQTEALIRELSQIIENDRYPFSPRIVDTEGDPGAATAGACSCPGTAATEDLRSTHQGQMAPTPRLGNPMPPDEFADIPKPGKPEPNRII